MVSQFNQKKKKKETKEREGGGQSDIWASEK